MTDSLSTAVPQQLMTDSHYDHYDITVIRTSCFVHTAFTLMVFRSPYPTWSLERRNFETSGLDINSSDEVKKHSSHNAIFLQRGPVFSHTSLKVLLKLWCIHYRQGLLRL